MAAQPSWQYMSVEKWRELERTSHDTKHEYIDGHVYAMAGGTLAHSHVGTNVLIALRTALTRRSCSAYNSDVAARLSPTRYTYPDVTVTCDERDQPTNEQREIQTPHVIVEVLSDTTERYDRGLKFAYYRACPTIQEYVLVSTTYQSVEVYRRTPEGWTSYQVYSPGDTIHLSSIDVHLPFAAFYEFSNVPETLDALEGENEV
jgi:Uma2 family endonuclease